MTMGDDYLEQIEKGRIWCVEKETAVTGVAWIQHPDFPGVALKHLIEAGSTGGSFSSHLVRVKEGCAIGEHLHPGKWELHEILVGQGEGIVDGKIIEYQNGVFAVIPADLTHSVKAQKGDLYLLAKFIPALL